ncbi:unnamed protein product [Acanthoscelides obtectus]|uniref:Uncharacterized protein n=1 Tax=Acanthoscelides obtectus TaxID=200917 RepID=A0A9P0P3Q4_ACAOB|nr:unnamed protein product [Acanthoscelides obtectus]CAK1669668.1 hypothetical protein AOBTE_LOCUS27149 [Acanthoscelides obtectus]
MYIHYLYTYLLVMVVKYRNSLSVFRILTSWKCIPSNCKSSCHQVAFGENITLQAISSSHNMVVYLSQYTNYLCILYPIFTVLIHVICTQNSAFMGGPQI